MKKDQENTKKNHKRKMIRKSEIFVVSFKSRRKAKLLVDLKEMKNHGLVQTASFTTNVTNLLQSQILIVA